MTEEEVDKYINQIAFSSAGEFLEKYKDQLSSIIGHFGLGFYSAFMVSKKVTINTLSWKEGAKAVKWECDGDPEYKMGESDKSDRGTEITLYLDDESSTEYASESKISELLNKYCKFMPIPIAFGKEKEGEIEVDKVINDTNPLWTRKPSELTEEDYNKFYRELYPMQEDPLFHIHLNVDYPFTLTGILYFPKIKDKMEMTRNKIQLYSNQVFVTDSVENIVPDFLTLLHGVIDSPDIPLNVSRSYLQSDSNVKKISSYITKKVADRLEEIFKNERAKLEEKWDNLKLFIEYGMLSDEKFYDRASKFSLLKNSDGKYFSYEDYKLAIEPNQTDKDNKLVYLYTTDAESQFSSIEVAKNRGYDVLIFDCQLDSHFVNLLESKFTDSRFARVDSDFIDKLIPKANLEKPEIAADELTDINSAFEAVLPKEANYNVVIENLGSNSQPILITQSEFMRRYKEMSAMGGGLNFYGQMPDSYTLTLNYEHPLIKEVLTEKEKATADKVKEFNDKLAMPTAALNEVEARTKDQKAEEIATADKDEKMKLEGEISEIKQSRRDVMESFGKENRLINQLTDLALLSNNMLKGKELDSFIKRSLELLK